MTRILIGLTLICAATVAAAGDEGIVRKASAGSVTDTLDKLEQIVKSKGFTVFARIDHAAGAKKVGQSLRPTQLLIFGNPKVGTQLLTSEQRIGLDLPIRVVAWEDPYGKVWLAYNDPAYLADRHDVEDREKVVMKMTGALKKLTDAATSAK